MSLDFRKCIVFLAFAAAKIATSEAAGVCPAHLLFLQNKCQQWQGDVLPETIPASRGNAVADNESAAALGMKVFYDNRFSRSDSGVACASCHDPEHAFSERKPTSHTIKEIGRNAPDLIDAAWYTHAHFWDGKVDNLWSAPLFTFEQEDEMGSSRLSIVHTLAAIYKIRYEKIFGPMPDMSDLKRFPSSGKPGTPQFDAMSVHDQELVNQVFVNLGKALEAYVRKLAAGRAPFDDFINGSTKSLSMDAQRGMLAFTRNGCDTCHSGPTFTDESFHSLGNTAKSGHPNDPGRAGGLAFAALWQFSSNSRYADPLVDGQAEKTSKIAADMAGFRTPSLRNVEVTAPYGHDGAFETLEKAIDAHAKVLPNPVGIQDKHDIIEFLHSLSGRPPRPPWNYWPGG